MNTNHKVTLKTIKLTDGDKKVILKNSDACTDLHGKGCNILNAPKEMKNK